MTVAAARLARLARKRPASLVEVALLVLAAACAAFLSVLHPSNSSTAGAPAATAPPGPPPPPPKGALVLAREDGPLAVALAVRPSGSKVELTGTVLDQHAFGVTGLKVSFVLRTSGGDTATVDGSPCGNGCYRGETARDGRPASVELALSGGTQSVSSVRFVLPTASTAAPAAPLVRRARRAIERLHSLVTYQRLGTDATHVDYTTFVAVAPDRMTATDRNGSRLIVIGKQGWSRGAGGRWKHARQLGGPSIVPAWGSDTRVTNAFLLGTSRLRGRHVQVISFAVPQELAWFTIWLDPKTDRTLKLRMTANAHFMLHRYSGFDRPFRIEPPR